MALSRREFLAASAGLVVFGPMVARGARAGGPVDPSTASRRRLVVISLDGGNDGLNTVIPIADVKGGARHSVYRKVRPSIAYLPEETLALDRPGDADHGLGLNRSLAYTHTLYGEGRVAVVQGVDYPNHNYSHFASTDIWHSADPQQGPLSGWLGRHLDRAGIGEGELRAVGLGQQLPLLLRGESRSGTGIIDIPSTRFADGTSADEVARARHEALARFSGHPATDALAAAVGRSAGSTVGVVQVLEGTTVPGSTGERLADALITARILLEAQLGVETVYVSHPGFDTHANQRSTQEALLAQLDRALQAFWTGSHNGNQYLPALPPALAERTLVMTISEFGRRIGEAGVDSSAGTDHGAAAPVLLVGPPAASSPLAGGIHGDHPDMGSPALPADDLAMTTDMRRVFESVLTNWLGNPDPRFRRYPALPGLFR